MKFWKLLTATICFVLLNSISIFANEWSWDIDDYNYYLIRDMQFNEWNNKTDVTVYNHDSVSYVLFTAGPIEGELAQFSVGIYDSNYETMYVYNTSSGLSHNMSFSEIQDLNLEPGTYRLSIVAKGFIDEALDDYTLYVSYVEPDNGTEETVTDNTDNGEVVTDNTNTEEVVTDNADTEEVVTDKNNNEEVVTSRNDNEQTVAVENNTLVTEKTTQNTIPPSTNSVTSIDTTTTVAEVTSPKRVSLQSVKRLKNKKKAKITWKKLKGNNIKYEIKCSTSKKFAKKKTKTYTTKKSSFTISKLAKNKKYYVKVRSYKTVDGKKVYGAYSKIKIIK